MELFYREKGDTALPPLILLHGLWGASDNWLPVAQLLSGRFHVVLPDFRNHGHSPHHSRHDYQSLSQDIQKFIRQFCFPSPPFMAGHSMGGKTLMYLLLKQPDIATKAAILDIGPYTYTQHPDFTRYARLLKDLENLPLDSYRQSQQIRTLLRQHFPNEEEYQLLIKNTGRTAEGFHWKINAPALSHHLGDLQKWPEETFQPYPAPVLFLRAEYSTYLPPSLPEKLLQLFPAARLLTLPQASHRLHVDQPKQLSEILSSWFLPH